jgi:glycosyltransferase involved in cell wall biosynthesis
MQRSITCKSSALPTVSAIALCYNHERFLNDCLESIKRQNYPNLQIIIADDGSKDASPLLIRRWIEQNPSLVVTFLHNEQNLGVCKTLNRALSVAQGRYISMIATDDLWESDKIRDQVAAMESLSDKTGVLYSDAYQIDEIGSVLAKRFIESHREFDRMPEGDIREILWQDNFIPAMTTLIRRSVFDHVGLYDENLFYEDWEMWLRISEHYHFAYFPRPTAKYRIVRSSMSKSSVDKMSLANELVFIKYLLQKGVPRKLRSQGFNFAVRRAYRERTAAPETSSDLLFKLVRIYKSPRLIYAWLLYLCGLEYRHYEAALSKAKRIVQFIKGRG